MTEPIWQTSTNLNDVTQELEQLEARDPTGPWSTYLQWVDDLYDFVEQIHDHQLQHTVDELTVELERLIEHLDQHQFALVRRARTALRALQQDEHFQRLRQEQHQTEENNAQHQKNHQRARRDALRAALESEFAHKCPKCGAAMNARENTKDQSTFWGCSRFRFNNPNSCRGTRPLNQIERAFMGE